MKICFIIKGVKTCINIPDKIRDPWRRGPDPDPRQDIGKWIDDVMINQKVAQDLSVLASINHLTNTLNSKELQGSMLKALHTAAGNIKVPEGVSLHVNETAAHKAVAAT